MLRHRHHSGRDGYDTYRIPAILRAQNGDLLLKRSSDGGRTWTAPVDAPALIEPVCQASLVRADAAKLLLFSNPADPKKRVNLTVRASADNAKTWRDVAVLHAGPSAYSCLVALSATAAACPYERGEKRYHEKSPSRAST